MNNNFSKTHASADCATTIAFFAEAKTAAFVAVKAISVLLLEAVMSPVLTTHIG
jgi:hypothetical protein